MRFDFAAVVDRCEKISPAFSKKAAMIALGLASPFNSHLKLQVGQWTNEIIQLRLRPRRGVQNHLGGIHAGALFTLGESCAGLLIVRNFNFKEYRPILANISVDFLKQARGTVVGEARLAAEDCARLKKNLGGGQAQFIEMVTTISNAENQAVARVVTNWQVKPWSQVRKK